MDAEKAYDIICNTLCEGKSKQITNAFLDKESFGNFVVEFSDETGSGAIICDRGQVHVCADPSGAKDCRLLVQSLYEATEQELVEAIQEVSAVST